MTEPGGQYLVASRQKNNPHPSPLNTPMPAQRAKSSTCQEEPHVTMPQNAADANAPPTAASGSTNLNSRRSTYASTKRPGTTINVVPR